MDRKSQYMNVLINMILFCIIHIISELYIMYSSPPSFLRVCAFMGLFTS